MYYLSRYDLASKLYYVVDTEDNVEEPLSQWDITKLTLAGVKIEGIDARIRHKKSEGEYVKIVSRKPYVPPTSFSARTVLLFGMQCAVNTDGTLLSIKPANESVSGRVELDRICNRLGAGCFTRECALCNATFVFSDNVECDINAFSAFRYHFGVSCDMDFTAVSDENIDAYYSAIGQLVVYNSFKDHEYRWGVQVCKYCLKTGMWRGKNNKPLSEFPALDEECARQILALKSRYNVPNELWIPHKGIVFEGYNNAFTHMRNMYTNHCHMVSTDYEAGVLAYFTRIFGIRNTKAWKMLINYITTGGMNAEVNDLMYDILCRVRF